MDLYRRVSEEEMRAGEKVNYVGLYPLKWGASQPTDGFVEVSDDELRKYLKGKEVKEK